MKIIKTLCLLLLFSFQVASATNIPNPELELLYSKHEIRYKIREVAELIDYEFQGEDITILMLSKNALFITNDFARELKTQYTVEFVDLDIPVTFQRLNLAEKNVIILDPLFDSGINLAKAVEIVAEKKPLTVKTVVAVQIKKSRSINFIPTYKLFEIEDIEIAGYGVEHKKYKNLFEIYKVKTLKNTIKI